MDFMDCCRFSVYMSIVAVQFYSQMIPDFPFIFSQALETFILLIVCYINVRLIIIIIIIIIIKQTHHIKVHTSQYHSSVLEQWNYQSKYQSNR